jgi:hypothetical protein
MAESKWVSRLFNFWAIIGCFWVVASFVCVFKCPDFPRARLTFRFAHPTAEEQALGDEVDRWVARLTSLRDGSLAYGLLGAVLFFRRGCAVFVIAATVVVVCQLALMELTWIPL